MEKKASRKQLLTLGGILTMSIPAELSAEAAQHWIERPGKIQAILREMLLATPGSFTTRPMLLWRDLFASCKLDVTSPVNFNEKNFPLEAARLDDGEWMISERRIQSFVTGEEAIAALEADGYRTLDGVKRAMEFIARNPVFQLDHQVVVTAAWPNLRDGQVYVPVFDHIDGQRNVRLRPITGKFPAGCGWLVLERVNP